MGIETKLLKYKKQIKQFQKEIERESGALSSELSNLIETIELEENTPQADVLKQTQLKIQELSKKAEKDQIRLDKLVIEIEEEVQSWDEEKDED